MKKKLLVIAVLLFFLVPLISGCVPIELPTRIMVNGGGWIETPGSMQPAMEETGNIGKATFGFTFDMYDIVWESGIVTSYKVKGHLTYVDHVTGEKIIGPITGVITEEPGGITGTYGDDGTFRFTPMAGNNPKDPDYFEIYITSGEYNCYTNYGMLMGGNIKAVSFY